MGRLIEMFKGKGDQAEIAKEAIAELGRSKTEVRVEIENTNLHFYSKFLLRSGAVVLKYPEQLKNQMIEERRLRIDLPESPDASLCLQILSARYGGTGEMAADLGQMTVLCKIPGATVEQTKRRAVRYYTGQYKDVLLALAAGPERFHVVDLSTSGVRVRIGSEEQDSLFPVGSYLAGGSIHLGKTARVKLLDAVPRYHAADVVGVEVVVDPAGISRKTLEFFIEKLAEEEKKLGLAGEHEQAKSS